VTTGRLVMRPEVSGLGWVRFKGCGRCGSGRRPCPIAGLGHDDGPSLLLGRRRWTIVGVVADHYADGTYQWWHLSQPSPELVSALGDGWLPGGGRVLDVGCGLGSEVGHLAAVGRQAVGVDLSSVAIARAATGRTGTGHGNVAFLRADVRALPFGAQHFDAAVDRGCFHYLPPGDRGRYVDELRRVLRPGGKFLLRASLRAAGERNDIDEAVIARSFASWSIDAWTEPPSRATPVSSRSSSSACPPRP
jgi:SAM-dependent methyltransferase